MQLQAQLARHPWALFDSNSFHPYPRSLAFADHLTPEAVLVAPVNWTTGNPVLAYNLAVVLALALSALGMFALVRRVTGHVDAAFLAGLAYAFTSFTRHELPRVHVLHVQWWPLALLFPAAVPFGLGQVLERLEAALTDVLADTPFLEWLPVRETALDPLSPSGELLCVMLGLLAPCLLGYCVIRSVGRRALLAFMVVAVGTTLTALSSALPSAQA